MRKLPTPPEMAGDENATEMIRVWIAHEDLYVSLLLGMWEDADDCDIDEREAWGELLADTISHIARGLAQSHGWDEDATSHRVASALMQHLDKPPTGKLEGGYVGD